MANHELHELVGDLMLSQEGAPQTHQSVLEISMNTGVHQSSVVHIVHDLFIATHPEENDRNIRSLI